jgi:phosphoglycerate dehydrogenase-like enzyme
MFLSLMRSPRAILNVPKPWRASWLLAGLVRSLLKRKDKTEASPRTYGSWSSTMPDNFRVALSGDFLKPNGEFAFPGFGLEPLQRKSSIELSYLKDCSEISSQQTRDIDALILSGPAITARSFNENGRLALIARFGVGYDTIDVQACTANNVALVITPDGVRRPVAVSILTHILVLTQKFMEKERLCRQGAKGWARVTDFNGVGLVGKVLGSVGFGNIAKEMFRITKPLEMRSIAYDPYVDIDTARELGVEIADLETVIRRSDILTINCPLNSSTRHLLDKNRLSLMKSTAILINTARGAIVDQAALADLLQSQQIAGAGLDVFEEEPLSENDPLLACENAVLTPHSLCWTDQLFSGCAEANIQAVLDVLAGKIPKSIVNKEIVQQPEWLAKLGRFATSTNQAMDARPLTQQT